MTAEKVATLKLRMWLHPWPGILVIAAVVGIVIGMFFDHTGRTQLFSLVSVSVLVMCWPFVRASLMRRQVPRAKTA